MGATNISLHLLVVILLTFFNALTADHIIVKPTGGDCATLSPCHTLSDYISNSPSIFNVSNTSLEFLPGTHNIGEHGLRHIIVKGLHNISWYGRPDETTEIVCEESMSFIFADIQSLSISNLQFSKCGHYLPSVLSEHVKDSRKRGPKFYNSTSAALALANIVSLRLGKVSICQSLGYGLFGLNLIGRSNILSCAFLENNRKCNESTTQHDIPNRDYCAGGNVMLLFLDLDTLKSGETPNESITHISDSRFHGGFDYSQSVSQCNSVPKQKSSPSLQYRVNGLGVITIQREYRVHVSIEGSNFSRNVGKGKHPAVLLHDSSGVTNNVTVTNCMFAEEGTFMISAIDKEDCHKPLCYQHYTPESLRYQSKNMVTLKECTFLNGTGNGLEICVNPIRLLYGRFQNISIQNCIFQHYQFKNCNSNRSVVRVYYNYTGKYTNQCPSVTVDVNSCLFSFNEIPAITCVLGIDTYSISNDKKKTKNITITCPLIVLQHTKLLHNYTPFNSTVTILTNSSKFIEIWKYENATNKYGNAIDRVNITNMTFTNNTSSSEMTKGVLCVERTYFTLHDCVFASSNGTGLTALNSVIRMKGKNKFANNRGIMGGGINLNRLW